MKILVTGNMGYVGSVLTQNLQGFFNERLELTGLDTGFFAHCLTGSRVLPEIHLQNQIFGDVRDIQGEFLKGFDAVIHLAAISNDPIGNKFASQTEQINYIASSNLAKLALHNGVKKFVFASSCSMYGYANDGAKKETDSLNPLTAYARSKVNTEKFLEELSSNESVVTSLRFSTACGMSPRLRLDLVLNDFVASAISSGEITILSDGQPWRPLIDVQDMVRAIAWALQRDPQESSSFLAVNVGSDDWNYQVKDLAKAVSRKIPDTTVSINQNAQPDKRSYKVDFSLFKKLAPNFQPQVTLDSSIDQLISGLVSFNFSDVHFRSSPLMRLKALEEHLANKRISSELRFF